MANTSTALQALRKLLRLNARLAKESWGPLPRTTLSALTEMTKAYGFSVGLGDLQHLGGRWYVTHAGLLRLARRNGCRGIRVQPLREFCDQTANRWVLAIYPLPVMIQSMLLPNRFFKRTRESSDGAAAPLSYRESCPCVTPSRLANSVWFSFPRKLRIRFPISLRSTKSPPRLGRPLIFLLTLCVSRILLLLIKAWAGHHVCKAPSQIWRRA